MPRKNLLSLFENFREFGGDVAVVQRRGYRREKLTYLELYTRGLFWGHALRGHGIRPGDRVLLWGPNSAEWVVCFWAILLQRAVAVPMDTGANLDFVQRVVKDAGVKLVLRDGKQPVYPEMPASLVIDDLRDVSKSQKPSGDAPIDAGDLAERSSIAEILYTSGTTAEPRGVVLTHGNFLANLEPLERGIDPYRKYEKWFHPLRFVTLVPLSHVFGQFMGLFVPPLLRATAVFENSGNAAEIIRTVKGERATALIAVPRSLDLLCNYFLRESEEGSSPGFGQKFAKASSKRFLRRAWTFHNFHQRFGLKFWAFISGGAALSPATETFFKGLGFAVVQGYGMTETASLISVNHPFSATEGSVGKVLPGREFRLSEDGEILVRGENVSLGYWHEGEIHPGEAGGWLRTGDLGELDAEGNLRFKGRKKNVIVTPAGLKVYPEDLENELRQENVRGCVVVPVKRGSDTEACAVLLPVREAADLSRPEKMKLRCAEAIQRANGRLAEYQKIRHWTIWPEPDFPRTPSGKPRLAAIAERAAEMLGGSASAIRQGGTLEDLLARFAKTGGASENLENGLNLTSLDRVELMGALEERYQVELNETSFAQAKTVADLQRLLQQPEARRREYIYPRWTQQAAARWVRLAVYYALAWPATQILGHPKIVGRENLRGVRGPALVVSNHITRRADIGLILAALPRRFRHRIATAMGGESLQRMRRPPRDWFFARRRAYQLGYWLVTLLFNVFPLPQHSGFRESFRFAGESVDRGYSILVFPEGEVNNSEDGRMAAFQNGVGLLAENLRLPIIPMRIDGVWKMKREHRRLAHFGEITVRIGAPIAIPADAAPEEIARRLEEVVASL
jgi:long-chain acyl-CoA synthetase